jgi:antitoxin HicB
MFYAVNLQPDDNGTLLVTCPSFPEVTSFGGDEADALAHALGAIEEAMAARIAAGQPIPKCSQRHPQGPAVKLLLLTTLKGELYNAARRQNVTRAELGRRLGWKRNSVDRLFQLNHRSRLEQLEAAFAALHQDVGVRVHELLPTARAALSGV